MLLAVAWVMTNQEHKATIYFPSRHVSDFIVWNMTCLCCIYTEPKERFLLMHMEQCVMLNLRRSVKTKRTIHFEYRTALKKTLVEIRLRNAKKTWQNGKQSLLSRSLFWDKALAHISRNYAGKVTGIPQTVLYLPNLDSFYSTGK